MITLHKYLEVPRTGSFDALDWIRLALLPAPQIPIRWDEPDRVEIDIQLLDNTVTRDLRVEVLFSIPARQEALTIDADRSVVMKFRGTEEALDELEERITGKNTRPFRLIYQLPSLSEFTPRQVLPKDFTWPEGTAPLGIEIVGYGEGVLPYTVAFQKPEKDEH